MPVLIGRFNVYNWNISISVGMGWDLVRMTDTK